MILLAVAITLGRISNSGADFFVSPTGLDSSVGSSSKPFHSLDRAREAVRDFRRDHTNLTSPVVVHVQKGVLEQDHAFSLAPEDSGTVNSPTIYRGERATISGGKEIRGFQVDSHGWWTVTLPEVRDGKWSFNQLFVNGKRRYRPRFPKAGYYNITEAVAPSESAKGRGYDRFGFRAGDIDKGWHNLNDVELLCFHTWDMSRMRIGSVDDVTHTVTTTGPTGYDADWANFPKGNRYIVENVREALSSPGEWYLDQKSGELTYIPLPGEKLAATTIVAPKADRLIDIKGDTAGHKFVEYVRFENLDFAYSNWILPKQGRFFPQAEVDLSAAVRAVGWRNGGMSGCNVRSVGEYALELGAGCRKLSITNSNFTDIGAGGVKIGETGLVEDENNAAGEVIVHNCVIAHAGRLHPAAIGVWIGQSAHNEISNNEIFDLYYTGVSIGWTWGYSKSQAHDDLIANNHIHDIGQGVLSDMGGIYTLGIEPGTKIIGNRIHDIDSFSYGGWGIYPDEGSSHELIENNVVYRTKSGGFHQHYGEDNTVRNNIFAFARDAQIIRTRAEDHLSFTFEHNIVFWKDAPLLGSNWSGNNYKLDGNLYWRIDGKPVDFAGMSLEAWRKKGQDLHSSIADPMFANPSKGDFRLNPNSMAFTLGFKPFDQSKAGLVGRTFKLDPTVPAAFPVQKAP